MRVNKTKILLADDEKELTRAVKIILEHDNYSVDVVENGLEVLEKIKDVSYSLIILDIMMPHLDGIKTVKKMRELKNYTPVLFLTAKTLVDDKVIGLDAGGNDYLTKPFNKKELLARIRVLTRKSIDEDIYLKNILFDKGNLSLSNGNVSLYLSEREAQILECLAANKNSNISLSVLKDYIKIPADSNDNIILLYISYLKNKFNVLDKNVKIILSKNGCELQC